MGKSGSLADGLVTMLQGYIGRKYMKRSMEFVGLKQDIQLSINNQTFIENVTHFDVGIYENNG